MFLKGLNKAEALFSRVPAPIYVRMGLAGLIVGLIAWPYPEVWGNGYETSTGPNSVMEKFPSTI